MPEDRVLKLDSEQTKTFDVEYVDQALFDKTLAQVDTGQVTRVLDVGGGNGLYADKLVEYFPQATVTNLEPDAYLAGRNQQHPRKRVLVSDFQHAELEPATFDLVFFSWVLHHFVGSSYGATLALQSGGLEAARGLLKPGGKMVIFENYYDGMMMDDLPGRLIYELTRSKTLSPFTARLGANTAGVGVCFHSAQAWRRLIESAGFSLDHAEICYAYGTLNALKRTLLHIKGMDVGLVIASPNRV